MQQLRYELTNGALPSIGTELDNEFALAFLDQLDYAYPMRTGDQMNNFWNVFGPATSNIWDGADIVTELKAADKSIITVVK
jgi:maltose-binding protein MalE